MVAETKTWTQQEYHSGKPPSKRYGHSAVVYSGCMYVFGGYDDFGYKSNELFEYRFGTCHWVYSMCYDSELIFFMVQTVTSGAKLTRSVQWTRNSITQLRCTATQCIFSAATTAQTCWWSTDSARGPGPRSWPSANLLTGDGVTQP